MRSTKLIFRAMRPACIGLLTVLLIACNQSGTSQEGVRAVNDAYTLRITGQADSAMVLLAQITTAHPDLAIGWYELSRAMLHTGMQSPQGMQQTLDSATHCIDRAIQKEPGNALYHSFKGNILMLRFYMAMQMQDEQAAAYLADVEETYKEVLRLDPTYYENKLTLVELYGILPEEMGGNTEKAEVYAGELEKADKVAGARAREILMPDDADYETFWKGINQEVPDNAEALQALGRIYLFQGDFGAASKHYEKAMALDPTKHILYLDLGRYQMMQAMQNPEVLDSVAPLVREQFDRYLASSPEPLDPMKAWTYGMLAMISRRSGDQGAAEEYGKMAAELDPYFPRSFGRPGMELYCPPGEVLHEVSYYMTPF